MKQYDQELSRLVEQMNRATRGSKPPMEPVGDKGALDEVLAAAVRMNASDVILVANTPVAMRISGALTLSPGEALSKDLKP